MTLDGIAGWEGSYDQDGTGEYLDQVRGNRKQRGKGGATYRLESQSSRNSGVLAPNMFTLLPYG